MPSKAKQEKCVFIKHHHGEKAAFGEELHLFLHCHLKGYDCEGKGKSMDASYYDKYGAPVLAKDAWTEGYFTIEKTLADHFNKCLNTSVGFPLVAGYGGGSHLYEQLHDEAEESPNKPWNWTGWIPRQAMWISNGSQMYFHKNRFFLGLRGNEIQNNLWNYHPHDEEEIADQYDWIYDQISPNDAYRGGYWYKSLEERAWSRYLHIMALKSHHDEPKRYNFIVHPLAYRSSLNVLPDASVDGIQWSIINIPFEEHFNDGIKNWGDSVIAMEVFNDFTYFYSWLPSGGYDTNNGRLGGDGTHIIWFDTYPLEYCEFLLDNALSRGTYLQILSANDAFYNRDILPLNKDDLSPEELESALEKNAILRSDPKGKLIKNQKINDKWKFIAHKFSIIRSQSVQKTPEQEEADEFLSSRPYNEDTVFGYTTLIDTKCQIKNTVFPNDQAWAEDLETGEEMMIDYLNEGRFYSHTGIYNLFNYSIAGSQTIPFVIKGQADESKLCYEISSDMEMKFTFPPFQCHHGEYRIWRYTIEQNVEDGRRETVHGYFKLDTSMKTVLDLTTRYKPENIKWIRFTIFDCKNPMKRAWFSPIRGAAFGTPISTVNLPALEHRIAKTSIIPQDCQLLVTESEEMFAPVECENNSAINLTYQFEKCKTEEEENYMYAYFAQGYALQADVHAKPHADIHDEVIEATRHSYKPAPRYLQNIQGYFPLSEEYPTRLELKNSWDSASIKKVYFYGINPVTCQPFPLPTSN